MRGVILKKDHLMSLKYLLILTVPIFIELLLQLVVGYSDQFMMKNMKMPLMVLRMLMLLII